MRCGGLYVTGTDTGVGKTAVATPIVRRLVADGNRVGVYKPVASGCGTTDADDARRLWEAAGRPATLAAVCPQSFAAPISPPRSARAEGRSIDECLLAGGLAVWRRASDIVVVEGAGGLFSPLADRIANADLAKSLGLPLVVVDAARLGTIGRTLATVRAAAAGGLSVAAVVLSHVVPPSGSLDDPASQASVARDCVIDLADLLAPVPVAVLRHDVQVIEPDLDWKLLAGG